MAIPFLDDLLRIPKLVYVFLAAIVLILLASFLPVVGNYVLGVGFVVAGVLFANAPFYEKKKGGTKISFSWGMLFGTVGIIIIGFNFLNINIFGYFGSVLALIPAETGSVVAETVGVQNEPALNSTQAIIATILMYFALDIFGLVKRKAK